MSNLLTTAQAAERLGVSVRRVQALIAEGRIAAAKIGRDYVVSAKAVEKFKPEAPGWKKGRKRKP